MNEDSEAIYDEAIFPLMRQVIEICKGNRIPMFATFQYREDGFCTTRIPFEGEADVFAKVNAMFRVNRLFAIAETIETKPDGSKHITIQRIS